MKIEKVHMNLVAVGFDCCFGFVFSRAVILLLLLIGCVETNPGPVRGSWYEGVHDKVNKFDDDFWHSDDGVDSFCDSGCMDDEFFDSSEDDFDDDNWLNMDVREVSLNENWANSCMKYSDDMRCLSVWSSRGKRKESGWLPDDSVHSGRKKKQNKRKGNYGNRTSFLNDDSAALHRALVRQMLPWRSAQKLSELLRIFADLVACMEFLVKVHKKKCRLAMLNCLSKYRRGCKVPSSSNPDGKISLCGVPDDKAEESSTNKPMVEKEIFFCTCTTPAEKTIKSMRDAEKLYNEAVLRAEEIATTAVSQKPNADMDNPFLRPWTVDYAVPRENLKCPKSRYSFWRK